MNAIFTRTSIRQFEEREVEQEKIEKLLQAAFASPTAKNQQAWEFYVVTNKEILQKLSQVTPFATPAAIACPPNMPDDSTTRTSAPIEAA